MHRFCRILLPLFLLLVAVMARASATGGDRVWPLAAEPAISSSFCEYREGHFHAGIDVRTFGREGIECIASADGYVSRVRATPGGYGQAVYIQLDDGQTLVYAHLSQFAPRIDSLVIEHQERRRGYSVDFRLPKNQLRVRRGEVIAYSGSTGGVDPHLHFEVRNAREHPLDPFEHGFALPDTMLPVIERIVFVPLDVDARINGVCYPAEYRTRKVAPGQYVIDDTVSVVGSVGLQTIAVDYLNAESGRLAPKTLSVEVDGAEVAYIEFEGFSFDHTDEVGFVYDVGRIWTKKEYVYQLYERAGETLFDRRFVGGGRLPLDSPYGNGEHQVRVVVTDVAGNSAELMVHCRRDTIRSLGRPDDDSDWSLGRPDDDSDLVLMGAVWPEYYVQRNFMSTWVGQRDDKLQREEIGIREGRWWIVSAEEVADRPLQLRRGDHDPTPWSLHSYIASARAGVATTLRFTDRDFLEIEFGERTLYEDAILWVGTSYSHLIRNHNPWQGALQSRSGLVKIGPFSLSLRADMQIRFRIDDPDSTCAIFRENVRTHKWVHYASTIEGDTVATTAKRPGVYAVFSDATPPSIGKPVMTRRLMYATGQRINELVIAIKDGGSGVDYRRCVVLLDGIKQIARWDGRAKKLFVLLRDRNIMGPRAITVVAYDNIGHRSQLDTTVDIPRQK